MRILILANVPPGVVGGAEVQTLNLATRWAATSHKVMIAGHANCPLQNDNLSIFRIPTLHQNRVLRAVSYLVGTMWFLWKNREGFDVIYCRFLREQALTAALAKIVYRLKQPVIACPACSSTGGDVATILKSPAKKILLWLLRNGVTGINAMSKEIEQEIFSVGLNDIHISHIPNGVTIPTIKRSMPKQDQRTRVLFVGRLVEQKGLDILLDAVNLLKELPIAFSLDIIGDGPSHQKLVKKVYDFGLEQIIHFAGAKPPGKISVQLRHANLFVLPSHYEGMSGALLEAIAHGLPAIVTNVNGFRGHHA